MTERPGKRASLDARGIKSHDHDGARDQAPEGHDDGCQKHGAIARPFHRCPPAVDQRRLFAEWGAGRHEILPTGLILHEAFSSANRMIAPAWHTRRADSREPP